MLLFYSIDSLSCVKFDGPMYLYKILISFFTLLDASVFSPFVSYLCIDITCFFESIENFLEVSRGELGLEMRTLVSEVIFFSFCS